jgi:hypothetical protein
MRLLSSIILILLGAVDHHMYQLPMSNAMTPQFVGNDLPRFFAMTAQ